MAHDWMCDATGFCFDASDANGKRIAIQGDAVKLIDGLKLTAKLPLPAYVRLLRHGEEIAKAEGKADFEFALKEPGAYRLEAWLRLDGELRPWIFANPIYVKALGHGMLPWDRPTILTGTRLVHFAMSP